MAPKVIVIEGAIAAGKSTLISKIREYYPDVVIVKEPVDEWVKDGVLAEFYGDKKANSYKFQTIAFTTRILEAKKMYELHGDSAVYILERSCMTDMIFMELLYQEGNVTDIEYKYYKLWAELWESFMPFKITNIIYLNTSVDNCMKRLEQRGRPEEMGISREYQEKLILLHEKMFEISSTNPHLSDPEIKFPGVKINILDSNKPVDSYSREFIENIMN